MLSYAVRSITGPTSVESRRSWNATWWPAALTTCSSMADMAACRDFAGNALWQLPGVRETRTYAVMEEVKNTTQLALGV